MDRWEGKVAVITGVSSGIGLAAAKALIERGVTVVGLARRVAKMKERMKGVRGSGKFFGRYCDVANKENVAECFKWVQNTFGTFNILINNSAAVKYKTLEDVTNEEMDHVVNVNVLGLLYCAKEALKSMKANEKEAHIINLNSVLGHKIPSMYIGINIYPATKFAVRAISEILGNELKDSKIRITNLSPGLVRTEMMDNTVRELKISSEEPAVEAEDVANAIIYVLEAPPHVEITEIIMQPKKV